MVKVVIDDKKGLVQESGGGTEIKNKVVATEPPHTRAGISLGAQTVAAAGANQGNAAAIDASGGVIVVVTGGDNTKAVLLPALSAVDTGAAYFILNNSSNTLEVFPASGDKITPASDDAAITVAANAGLWCFKADATQWVGAEPAAVGA